MADRFFQWLIGEKQGDICIFEKFEKDDNKVYVKFKDNSRIDIDLVAELNVIKVKGKYIAEVENPTNIWKIEEKWIGREKEVWSEAEESGDGARHCIQPFVEGKKVTELIPPKQSLVPRFLEHNLSDKILNDKKLDKIKKLDLSDPVYIMMEKAKKVDTNIEMSLVISLPNKNLYDVAKESFDEGDKKTIEYIIENIDISKIKESLKNGIAQMYEQKEFSFEKDIELTKEPKQTEKNPLLDEPEAIEEPIISKPKLGTLEEIKGLSKKVEK